MYRFWRPVTSKILDIVQPRVLVEVGSEDAHHTLLLLDWCAAHDAVLHVIEPYPRAEAKARAMGYGRHCVYHEALSLEALPHISAADVVMIDGDHNWYTVINELRALDAQALADGRPFPLVCLHDVAWPYGRRDLYYKPDTIPAEHRQPHARAGILPGVSEAVEGKGLNRNYFNALHEGTPRNGVLTAVEDFLAERGADLGLELATLPYMSGLGIVHRRALRDKHPELGAFLDALRAEDPHLPLLERVEGDRTAILLALEDKRAGAEFYTRKTHEAEQEIARLRQRVSDAQTEAAAAREQADAMARRLGENQVGARNAALRLALEERRALARSVWQQTLFVERMGAACLGLQRSSRWRAGNRVIRWVERAQGKPSQSKSPDRLRDALSRFDAWKAAYRAWEKGLVSRDVTGRHNGFATEEELQANLQRKDALLAAIEEEKRRLAGETRTLAQFYEETAYYGAQILRSWRWRVGAAVVGTLAKFSPRPKPPAVLRDIQQIDAGWKAWRRVYGNGLPVSVAAAPAPAPAGPLSAPARPKVDLAAVRVTQFTPPNPRNPYYSMIARQLRDRGWNFEFTTDRAALLEQVRARAFPSEIVHFHQFDPLYHAKNGNVDETRQMAGELLAYLRELKGAGAKLVHTAHNPKPHHPEFAEIDEAFQRDALALMDRVVVLGERAARALARQCAGVPVVAVPHPSFRGVYGAPIERAAARERLGLDPGAFIFGNLGEIRPYKELECIIDAFEPFAAAAPAPRPLLLLAGKPGPPEYVEAIRARAGAHVRIHAEEIADADVPLWLGAMDAAVFAFREIWMSSSVMLALSYAVPPVAPDRGCLPEYVFEEDTGFLYEHGNVDALRACLARAHASPLLPHLRYMCAAHAEKWSVENVAARFEHIYAPLAGGNGD